ncbi:MAG: isochorismate synthase [Bifidobacteriaceae bacterium]|jgi:menaquinone-specific isochorismate synthase|nr:isochorismate synthase [Bifidobacteriaceae bacterium]
MIPALTFTTTPAAHPADLLDAIRDGGEWADQTGGSPSAAPLTVWLRRGEGFVGLGQAATFNTLGSGRFGSAEQWWRAVISQARIDGPADLPGMGPLAFGTFAFADNSPEPSALIVPRWVLARFRGQEWITTARLEDESAPSLPPIASPSGPVGSALPPMRQLPGPVSAEQWPAVVERAISLIKSGQLEKVVLARSVLAESLAGPVDPELVVRNLVNRYRDTWTFAVDGLVGASPEMLVRSTRGLVTSRILAGTIRSTGCDQADLARAAALARSSKDLEEHEFAVASVVDALQPFTEELAVPDGPSVLHLPNLMHLATEVVGELRRSRSGALPGALTLASALHPSAAVCGTPKREAARVIGQLEKLDRGRYSAPVGWIDANGAGEWAIALRCAQLSPDGCSARLWAGGGIVAASNPDAELAETEAKLAPMREALGLTDA